MNEKKSTVSISEAPSFPLSLTQPGERVRIVHISGGKGLQERLLGMGINRGDVVQVKHRQKQGAVVVSMNSNRFGMGGGMAMKIFVVKE